MKATTFTLLLSIATAINAAAFEDSRLKALFARDAEISFGATLSAEISHGFGHHHGHTADLSSGNGGGSSSSSVSESTVGRIEYYHYY